MPHAFLFSKKNDLCVGGYVRQYRRWGMLGIADDELATAVLDPTLCFMLGSGDRASEASREAAPANVQKQL